MKYTTFKKGGYGTGLITTTGGDVYGRVFLSRDPEGAMEAATKNYADLSITTLSASSFTTGTLDPARVPEFTGDIVKAVGGLGINYSDTGISAGTYPKISVDRKGRATGGGSLVESDLPDIPFSKIGLGKPTTLAGYGILDALSKTGGTLSGRLTAQTTGDLDESVITKGFVDASNLGTTAIPLGSIVYKGGKGPFFGFLRGNGSMASKVIYDNLYAKIGDKFAFKAGYFGNGQPWMNHTNIGDKNTGLGSFAGTGTPVGTMAFMRAFITKNKVFLIGNNSPNIKSAPINEDGTIGAWSDYGTLPVSVANPGIIVTKNKVHIVSGTGIAGPITANILENGDIGDWSYGGNGSNPPNLIFSSDKAVIVGDRVYLIGGGTSGSSPALPNGVCFSSVIQPNGDLGPWNKESTLVSLPDANHVFVIGDKIYACGGANGASIGSYSQVARVMSDGSLGPWVATTPIPANQARGAVFKTNKRVWILGGIDGTTFATNRVYTAPIDENGNLGAWAGETGLPSVLVHFALFATSSKLYIAGGYTTGAVNYQVSVPITGGLNDYSRAYDGAPFLNTETHFKLPDIPQNSLGLDAWIKA